MELLLLIVTTVLVLLLAAIYNYTRNVKNKYDYWKTRGIVYLKPQFPFGNVKEMFTQKKSFTETFSDFYDQFSGHKYGGIFHFQRPTLILRDPELIKQVLVKSFEAFHDHGFYFDEKTDPLAGHLFNVSGTTWRNLRTKLSPTFTSGKMKMMFGTIVKCGEELKSCIKAPGTKNSEIEIKDLLSRYSIDVIASCAFGIEANCLRNPDAEFRVWSKRVTQRSLKASLRHNLSIVSPTLASLLKSTHVPEDVTKYFINAVRETVEYRERNNVKRNDFMELLIQLKNKGFVDPDESPSDGKDEVDQLHKGDNKALTIEQVAAQAFVFYAAGSETSSNAAAFCLYELARHTDIQEKLRREINGVLNKHGGKLTYEALQEMEYLEKVVLETLRLHAPAPMIQRVCNRDFVIEETGHVIEKGVPVIIPIHGIQRDSKYYPNADSFNPENFSKEALKQRSPCTFLAFGEGPRICIGQRFALIQVKVGLISILQDNEISLSSKTAVPLKLNPKSFTASPAGGLWIKIVNS